MKKLFLLNLLLFWFLTSCGGGGSSENTPTYKIGAPKILKAGDTFSYDLTGSIIVNGETISLNGDAKFQVLNNTVENPYGITCKEYSLSLYAEYKYQNQKQTLTEYYRNLFYQDSQGNFYDCGEYDTNTGQYIFITNSNNGLIETHPINLTIGQSIQYRDEYSNGEWEDCSYIVEDKTYIKVPYGNVEAYKISGACSDNEGYNQIEVLYTNMSVAPIIKSNIKTNNIDITISLREVK